MLNIVRNYTEVFFSDPFLLLVYSWRYSPKEIALERESYPSYRSNCSDSPMYFS